MKFRILKYFKQINNLNFLNILLVILNLTIHAHLRQIILLKIKHTHINTKNHLTSFDRYISTLLERRIHITRESKILGNLMYIGLCFIVIVEK